MSGISFSDAEQFEMTLEEVIWYVTGYPNCDLTDADIYELINDIRKKVSVQMPIAEMYKAAGILLADECSQQ